MATPTDQANACDVAIFGLPDELLMNVFTYITTISKKIELEQVSKRFRFVSSQSPSWRGIDKLEIMMGCDIWEIHDIEMKGNCKKISHLNNHIINVDKWPAAVQLLIDRTQIQQLVVHGGGDNHILELDNPTLLTDLMEIFKKNGDKMKIEFLEFHYEHDPWYTKGPYHFDRVKSFLCDSIQMSIPFLKELVYHIRNKVKENSMCEMWPIVRKCQNLRSIAFEGYMVNVDALVGKPLTKMKFGGRGVIDMDGVARVINGASGQGVSNLTLIDTGTLYINLRGLCDGLNEKSREKLKIITITLHYGGFNDIMRLFPFIPSMFPNLQKLHIRSNYYQKYDMIEVLTNFVSFLTLCLGESFPREIVVQKIAICTKRDEFKLSLTNKCEAAEINVQFDKMEDLHCQFCCRNLPESVLLSKGKASIRMDFCDEDDLSYFY